MTDRRPICIWHKDDVSAYYAASEEEQDAWNAYANQAAEDFNNSGLDSYDSTSTYPGWDRDGNQTKWCPPLFFPEWLERYRRRSAGAAYPVPDGRAMGTAMGKALGALLAVLRGRG